MSVYFDLYIEKVRKVESRGRWRVSLVTEEQTLIYCANKEHCLGQEEAFFIFIFLFFHVFRIRLLLLA